MPRLLIASNRSIHPSCSDESLFGSGYNEEGPCELRLAEARCDLSSGKWSLNLLPEDHSQPGDVCYASRSLFQQIVSETRKATAKDNHWVFFVPGYCSPCKEGLDKSLEMQKTHDVNVILFSWPSDPRRPEIDPVNKYKRTQEAARLSSTALDRTLRSLERVLVVPARSDGNPGKFKFSLLAHSLGNYIIQDYIQAEPIYTNKDTIFDNIILHQPDVDYEGHDKWISKLKCLQKIYVTTNYYDSTLGKISDLVNPMRLGQATKNVSAASDVTHVDFTGAGKVEQQHWFFGSFNNTIISKFCTRVLQGELGECILYQDPADPGRYQAFPFSHFPRFQE